MLALALRQLISNLLYGGEQANLAALAAATLVLLVAACLAMVRPTARVARVDSAVALREE